MSRVQNFLFPVLLFAIVLGVFTGGWYLFDRAFPPAQDNSLFGDKFGAISALFSGLAFAGLIWAVRLQGKELALQREELAQTREELKGQKEQLAQQNSTMQRQNFEATFFSLLAVHNDLVSNLEIDVVDQRLPHRQGRACFTRIFSQLKSDIETLERNSSGNDSIATINEGYMSMFHKRQSEIGHYFRTLYNIVKFVDQSSSPNKQLYLNLIRAQLSHDELRLIFYNCLSEMGRERFRPLIEKYALFEQLSPRDLISEQHYGLYSTTAYKEQERSGSSAE